MTTWTGVSTSSTSWTNVSDVAQGYFETEDNKNIAPGNWQDIPAVATTTWTVQ